MPEGPFDLVLLGLGVNGHLAFNDPPADFDDPADTRVVTLDDVSRRQQVDEGHFPTVDDVPQRAITVTIPRLLRRAARHRVGAGRSEAGGGAGRRSPARSARISPVRRCGPTRTSPCSSTPTRHRSERDQPGADPTSRRSPHLLRRIEGTEAEHVEAAARLVAERIADDRLVHVYGPGGHSNLATQEVFFRAGGLMHVNAILDEGTLLSNGALRSMAVERLPGYGRVVIERAGLTAGDLLVLVNAYGINSALIDAAMAARDLGVTTVGVSSRAHAEGTAPDHPARHPSGRNLHDLVDVHIDTKVPVGDAVVEVPGASERTAAVSTFANAFAMNWLVMTVVEQLAARGHRPADVALGQRSRAATRPTPGSSPGSRAGSATCEHTRCGAGTASGGRRRGPLAR